jgi:hypothetical protein
MTQRKPALEWKANVKFGRDYRPAWSKVLPPIHI